LTVLLGKETGVCGELIDLGEVTEKVVSSTPSHGLE